MTEARPRLVLIDGYAVAYRSYFATKESLVSGRAFRTTKGEPTNAVHGFAGQLLDIMKGKEPPQYLAVVFDAGLSNRDTTHVEYKTNRVEMDPDMDVQIPRIRQLVEAFNIPLLELDGYEADDVIGTIAHQADNLGVHVHIVTVDSDLLQLVNDNVTVQQLIPMGDAKFYDTEAVVARFGVRPDQIRDYKALVGDSSDNYPGVAGIGKGTAPKLLQQYETIENLYLHVDEIKGSQKDKLVAGRANAFLGKQLATIITDLPIHVELEKCATHDYDVAKVDELFQELEFNSIRKRIGLTPAEPASAPATKRAAKAASAGQLSMFADEESAAAHQAAPVHVVHTVIVNSQETLAELLQALANAKAIAFDTETDSLDQIRANLVGISLAVNGETGYYIPVGHKEVDGVMPEQLPLERVIEALRPAMTDPEKEKYAHNAAFDLIILRRHGIDVTPITMDTMVGEWLNRPDSWRKGLKEQAWLRLGVRMTEIDELIGKGKNQITMAQVPVEKAAPYAAADAAITFRLVEPVCADLEANRLLHLFKTLEMPLVPVITDLDMAGVTLDMPFLADLSKEFEQRLNEKMEAIHEAAGEPFNIGSPKQLNTILFEKLKLPTAKLGKSAHGFSVDAAALEELKQHHPIISLIMDWRSLEKLRSTYVDAMPKMVDEKNRIHTTYNQTGAVTGRISSEAPNLQNIPVRTEEGRRVRRAFIAPEGFHLLSADYSQIELRILAHYSGDPFLIDAFEHDQDIHRATAAAVASIPFDQVTKDQRYFAKRVNFGLLYGMGAHRLVRESELSYADAKTFIDQYFTRLSGVKQYMDGVKELARTQGYLETMLGRRRDFSLLRDDHPSVRQHDRARMEREAINTPIQGTAADIIKLAMLHLSARLKQEHPRSFLILQVHDELVLEVPDDEIEAVGKLVIEEMQSAVELKVPLKAEANVGKNWAEMTPMAEWLAKVGV
ncbi:MAG: DNA polymerase I [Anaerolineae bacterium]|nr:DNA polymerase I [Anaerolineae bacterium]